MSEFFCPDKNQLIPDYSEIARYLGYKKSNPPTAQVYSLMEKAVSSLKAVLTTQAVFETFDLKIEGEPENTIIFADAVLKSKNLTENLNSCSKVTIFAATLGPQVDSIIRRAQITDSAYAAVLQATGAMYIEQLVNLLNEKIKNDAKIYGKSTKPRYSPGYGDVPLEVQKIFFRLLPCARIGLTLMDTLIMAPEKSVTGFIGIY